MDSVEERDRYVKESYCKVLGVVLGILGIKGRSLFLFILSEERGRVRGGGKCFIWKKSGFWLEYEKLL